MLVADIAAACFHFGINASGDDKNVRIAVVIEIDNACAPANEARLHAEACRTGHIVKLSLAVVAIKTILVLSKMSLQDVEMSVQIVIADTDTHARLFTAIVAKGHAAHNALFAKSSIVVIHEQQAGGGVARDEDVRPAVFVRSKATAVMP